mgnify:CR=1 FL=1
METPLYADTAPKVVLELKQGLIDISYYHIPSGWVGASQMIAAAMGPALTKAVEQLVKAPHASDGLPAIIIPDLQRIKH